MAINFEKHIAPIKERSVYPDEDARRYLSFWFRVNDNLLPNFVSREEWQRLEQRGVPYLDDDGSTYVDLPEDIKLWEVLDFVRLLDQETYVDRARAKLEREKLKDVVGGYRSAGIYLKTYIDRIDWSGYEDAQLLAKEMATDFYRLSRWLILRRQRQVDYETIPVLSMVEDEDGLDKQVDLRKTENLLLGKNHVQKRYERLEKGLGRASTSAEEDELRKKTILAFFVALTRSSYAEIDYSDEKMEARSAKQDLSWNLYVDRYLGKNDADLTDEQLREKSELEGEFVSAKPWENIGPSFAFQQAASLGIERFYLRPKIEFEKAVMRRGRENIRDRLKEAGDEQVGLFRFLQKMGFDFSKDRQKLIEKLNIEQLRTRLKNLKESDAEVDDIVSLELTIVDRIQAEISRYVYESKLSLPVEILDKERINCVGASILASVLFDEVGISYLEASIEHHSVVVVRTHDGELYYRDMRYAYLNTHLTENELGEENLAKAKQLVDDDVIVRSFMVNPEWYRQIKFDNDYFQPRLTLYKSNRGVVHGLVNNFIYFLLEDVEANRESIGVALIALESYLDQFPDDLFILTALAEAFMEMSDFKSAMVVLYRIEKVEKDLPIKFMLWGEVFYKQGKYELALEALRKTVAFEKEAVDVWGMMVDCLERLGRVGAFRKTLEQAISFTGNSVFKNKLAEHLVEIGEISQALDLYEEFVGESPHDSELWTTYYYLIFVEDPTQGNCRMALTSLAKYDLFEKMDRVIEIAFEEHEDEEWPMDLAKEFAVDQRLLA